MRVEIGMQIINGTKIAKQHEGTLRVGLMNFHNRVMEARPGIYLRRPVIMSFCNQEDLPSVKYTEMKRKKAEDIGIDFIVKKVTSHTPQVFITDRIQRFNLNDEVDGTMVQLPLPKELNIFQPFILNQIAPDKDVDGLTEEGRKIYLPATVKSVMSILDEGVKSWEQMKIGVAGSEGEVGRPLVDVLRSRIPDQQIVRIDRKIPGTDIKTDLAGCDLVISAIGREHIITPRMLQQGVVVIDVGLGGNGNGDFDPRVFDIARLGTQAKGGVGPMTVISLMENGVDAYMRHVIKQYELPEDFARAA